MHKYLKLVNQLIGEFDQVSFVQVPLDQNLEADKVAKYTLSEDKTRTPGLKLEVPKFPSIEEF